jgi:hypothetical protein
MGTPTANKNLIIPTLNGDFGTWGSEINGDISTLDLNLGGAQIINVAGNVNVVASLAQSQYMFTFLNGLLTGNINYVLPPVGGLYIIFNGTTGAHNVTIACAGGGITTLLPQSTSMTLACDGVNVVSATSAYALGGGAISAPNLNVTGSAIIGGALTASSTLAVSGGVALGSTLGVVGAATISGLVTTNGGYISTGFTAGGGQFVAISGNYGAMMRNDGVNCFLLSTANGAPFGVFNAFRPFSWSLATGAVTIDAGGQGAVHGGTLQVNGALSTLSSFTATGQISTTANIVGGGLISTGTISASGGLAVNGVLTANGVVTANSNINCGFTVSATNVSVASTVTGGQLTSTGNINAAGAIGATGAMVSGNMLAPLGTIGGVSMSSGSLNATAIGATGNIIAGQHISTNGTYVGTNLYLGFTSVGGIATKNGNGPGNSVGYGANAANIWYDGAGNTYIFIDSTPFLVSSASDARAKQDIQPVADNALGRIGKLKPISYRHKPMGVITKTGETREGFLAQDVRKIIPSAVYGDEENPDHILQITPNPIIATLVKAVQELSAKVDAQHIGNGELRASLVQCQSRIIQLEMKNQKIVDNFRVDL